MVKLSYRPKRSDVERFFTYKKLYYLYSCIGGITDTLEMPKSHQASPLQKTQRIVRDALSHKRSFDYARDDNNFFFNHSPLCHLDQSEATWRDLSPMKIYYLYSYIGEMTDRIKTPNISLSSLLQIQFYSILYLAFKNDKQENTVKIHEHPV